MDTDSVFKKETSFTEACYNACRACSFYRLSDAFFKVKKRYPFDWSRLVLAYQ